MFVKHQSRFGSTLWYWRDLGVSIRNKTLLNWIELNTNKKVSLLLTMPCMQVLKYTCHKFCLKCFQIIGGKRIISMLIVSIIHRVLIINFEEGLFPLASEAHCGYTSFHKFVVTICFLQNLCHWFRGKVNFDAWVKWRPKGKKWKNSGNDWS